MSVQERRAARRAARRAELLEAADRVIRRLGPAAAMDDIAAEAGITKVVLYRHFGDKGGLYQALAERYVRALLEQLRTALASPGEPRARLAATIDAYVSFIEDHREAYDFLMHRAVKEGPAAQATVTDFMRGVAREVGDELATQVAALGIDPAPAQAWAHGVVGLVHLATDWWFDQRVLPRAWLVEHLVALLWDGFAGIAQRAGVAPATGTEQGG